MIRRQVAMCWRGMLGLALLAAIPSAHAQSSSTQTENRNLQGDSSYARTITQKATISATGDLQPVQDDAVARREWMRQRMGGAPTPEFKMLMMREAMRQRALYPALSPGVAAPIGVPNWVAIGPTEANYLQNGPFTINATDSGRVRTILPHPTDQNTLYLLTSGGGLWKTTNFTQARPTWVPKSDALLTTSGGAVALGRDPQTLYLGLGDPFDNFPLVGGAMLKSSDGGDTWSGFANLAGATSVRDVNVDTSALLDIVLVATDAGLFRSADGADTYVRVAGGLGEAFDGKALWSLVRTSAGWLASAQTRDVTGLGSLFLSTDQGTTWHPIDNPGNRFSGAGRTTLGVGAPGDNVVYAFAATARDTMQLDLFRSTDGGQSWTPLLITNKAPTNPNPDQRTMNLMGGQAFYNHLQLVDPSDPTRNTVYLGGQLSSAKTTDGGNTWTLLTNWLAQFGLPYVHADFHAAALTNFGATLTLLFGTDGGLFVSDDSGIHWADKNVGLVTHLVYSLTSNPSLPSSVLIGLQDNGTRVRSGSSTIYNQSLGGDGLGVGWTQANNDISLGTVPFSDIRRNFGHNPPDLIQNWLSAVNGIDRTDAGFFTPVTTPTALADPIGRVFFTSTFHHVYNTTVGATSWTAIGTSGVGGISPSQLIRSLPHAIGVSPVDTNHVGAAGTNGVVLLTADGGASWVERPLNTLVPGYASFNSNVAWADNNTIYVSSESPVAGAIRVVRSTDGGVTWSAANTGLPDVSVTKLQVDPRDPSGNTVYAATFLGVDRTTDGGTSWQLFGAGLPQVPVTDIYMPPDGGLLRVSTFGRGVWEILPLITNTIVNSSLNPSALGDTVTFTAAVTSAGGIPTGTVTFMDGTVALGSAALDGFGQATFTTSSLAVGSHSITAVYGGDIDFARSTSPVFTQTVI